MYVAYFTKILILVKCKASAKCDLANIYHGEHRKNSPSAIKILISYPYIGGLIWI